MVTGPFDTPRSFLTAATQGTEEAVSLTAATQGTGMVLPGPPSLVPMAKDPHELKDKAQEVVSDVVDVVEEKVPVRVRPHIAILLPAIIGAFLLGLMTWAASEIYEAVSEQDELYLLDQPVLDAMVSIREPWLNTIVGGFTHVGGTILSPILATIIVVVMCRLWRTWLPLTLMLAAGLGSIAVTVVGKNYIDRVRPPHEFAIAPFENSPSFPSGHSLNAVVIAGVVTYLLWRRLETRRARVVAVVLAVIYAVAMGLSRVYLGHHWLTDVMTGWLLGGAWLALVITTHLVSSAFLARRREAAAISAPPSADADPEPNDDHTS